MSETDESSVGCAHDDCERDVDGEEHCYWHREEKGKEPGSDDSPVTGTPHDLTGAYFRDATFTNEIFWTTILNHVNFREANLTNIYLRGAKLIEADIQNASIDDANLVNANLTNAELCEANLTDAELCEANLTDAELSEANLTEVKLHNANLTDAELSEANLTGAKLHNADLTDAELSEANFTGAKLHNADLTNAELHNADLTNAELHNADLTGADLRDLEIKDIKIDNQCNFGSRLPKDASDMTDHARAYHDLRTTFSNGGYDKLARDLYVLEQKARTRAAVPWNPLTFLGGLLSGLLTGYGVRPRQVLISTATVVCLTTLWFSQVGVRFEDWNTVYEFFGLQFRTGSLYYSVVTFVTAPPHPPQSTDLVTNALVTLETYLGTVLTLLLGYALSNRSRV